MLRIDTAGKLGARVANVTLPSYKIDAVAKDMCLLRCQFFYGTNLNKFLTV